MSRIPSLHSRRARRSLPVLAALLAAAMAAPAAAAAAPVAAAVPGIAQVIAPNPPPALPPGWCYSDPIGTYPCDFQLPPWFPWDAADCPEGYVRDAATGKCINEQLTVPRPVPAGRRR